jgi:hypothetical protein
MMEVMFDADVVEQAYNVLVEAGVEVKKDEFDEEYLLVKLDDTEKMETALAAHRIPFTLVDILDDEDEEDEEEEEEEEEEEDGEEEEYA